MTVRVFPNLESEDFNKFKNKFWILASSPNVCLGNRSGRTCAWNTWMRRVNKKRKNKKKWEKSWKISEVNDISKNERAFYYTVVWNEKSWNVYEIVMNIVREEIVISALHDEISASVLTNSLAKSRPNPGNIVSHSGSVSKLSQLIISSVHSAWRYERKLIINNYSSDW